MTPRCPDTEEITAWIDREVGPRRGDEIQRHVASCATCGRQAGAIEQLIADLRAPAREPSRAAIAGVLARLDGPPPRRPARRVWLAGASAAAACAVAALVLRAPTGSGRDDPGRDDRGFRARGGGSGAGSAGLERRVGTTLYTVAPATARGSAGRRVAPLAADAAVHGDTAFTLGYRNLAADRALWLLSFAVDAAGDVHWLYPGYTRVGDDPSALELASSSREIIMPDSVILERPAAGRLRVVTVIAPSPLRVSAIEALPASELALPALARRFPGAVISELPLHVVP